MHPFLSALSPSFAMTSSQKDDKILLFIDWDETITSHDTLSLIAPPDNQHEGKPFSDYLKAYLEDMKEHEKDWQFDSNEKEQQIEIPRKNESIGKGWEEYFAFQGSLDEIELKSLRRIEKGGLFFNSDPFESDKRAKQVQFRKGWKEFAILYPYHIISVGWSARFMKSSLKTILSENSMPLTICANEIEIDQKIGLGSGRLTKSYDLDKSEGFKIPTGGGGMRNGQHKVREMRRILKSLQKIPFTIYVGDSTTDLGSLIEANVGLIIGEKQGTLDAINKADLQKYLISPSSVEFNKKISELTKSANNPPCLIPIKDWDEATQIIQSIESQL